MLGASARLERRGRSRVVLVALWVLTAQLASLAHLGLVQHQLCLEHGEYTHVTSGEKVTPAEAAAANSQLPRVSLALALGAEEHDHCSVLLHRVAQQAQASVACALPALAVPGTPGVQAPQQVPPSRALYRLSPKQSPPAAV